MLLPVTGQRVVGAGHLSAVSCRGNQSVLAPDSGSGRRPWGEPGAEPGGLPVDGTVLSTFQKAKLEDCLRLLYRLYLTFASLDRPPLFQESACVRGAACTCSVLVPRKQPPATHAGRPLSLGLERAWRWLHVTAEGASSFLKPLFWEIISDLGERGRNST